MLAQLLDLRLHRVGDFNITAQEFLESGWASKLKATVLHPNAPTTISSAAERPIDFGFISDSIKRMFKQTRPIFTVPTLPHCGLMFLLTPDPDP